MIYELSKFLLLFPSIKAKFLKEFSEEELEGVYNLDI